MVGSKSEDPVVSILGVVDDAIVATGEELRDHVRGSSRGALWWDVLLVCARIDNGEVNAMEKRLDCTNSDVAAVHKHVSSQFERQQ